MKRLIGIIFLLSSTALATRTLTWSQSVQQAIQANPDLQSAQSSAQAARAQARGAYSNFFPQLSSSLTYSYGNSSSDSNNAVSPSTDTRSIYGASLTASQNLFSGFLDDAKVNQAQASRQVSEAALTTAAAKASYDLKAAYTGLMYSQKLIQLTEDIARRRESNLKLVQLRFESGRENKGSVLLSKAYLEQAKYEHLQATNALHLVQLQLAKVLGYEDTEELQVQGEVPLSEPPPTLDLKQLALETPDYAQAVAQEFSAKAGLDIARAGFYPTFNLTGTTGNTGNHWFPDNNRWSIGANITLPLFNGGRDFYTQRAAGETWRAATFSRQSVTGQTIQKIHQAYSAYLEAVQKVNVDRSFVDAATTREKIAREKYNNGLLTFDDWDIIETDLISRQKVFLQSQRDRTLAEAAWEQAQGKGVLQ